MDPLEEQWWKEVAVKVYPGQLRAWLSRFWAVAEREGADPAELDPRFTAFRQRLLRSFTRAIEGRAKALTEALARGARKEAEKLRHGEPLERELEQLLADALEDEFGTAGQLSEPPGAGDELYFAWLAQKVAGLELPGASPVGPAVETLRAQPDDATVRQVYLDSLLASGDPCGELARLMSKGLATRWLGELRLELDDSLGPLAWLPLDLHWRDGVVYEASLATMPDAAAARVGFAYVLRHPLCVSLQMLNLPLYSGQRELVEPFAAVGPQPQLKTLKIADHHERDSQLDFTAFAPLVPRIEELSLSAAEVTLGELELPTVKWLHLTCARTPEKLAADLAGCRLPALRTLSFSRQGAWDEAGELRAIPWESDAWVPTLAAALSRHTPGTLILRLPFGPAAMALLAPSLERRSLTAVAFGRHVVEEHARELLRFAPRLGHLKRLVFQGGQLEGGAIDALQRALPQTNVACLDSDQPLDFEWGPARPHLDA